jgi:phosphatidylglycerophosphatase A
MLIFDKIKKLSFKIATVGGMGEWRSGKLLASLFAFPILFLFKVFYGIAPNFLFWLILGLVFCSVLVVHFALSFVPGESSSPIVLDKVIGLMITFAFIPLKWKLMIFGFVLFHLINIFRPFLFCKTLGKNIEKLPGAIGIVAGDAISGIICNVFLQLIVWIMS